MGSQVGSQHSDVDDVLHKVLIDVSTKCIKFLCSTAISCIDQAAATTANETRDANIIFTNMMTIYFVSLVILFILSYLNI